MHCCMSVMCWGWGVGWGLGCRVGVGCGWGWVGVRLNTDLYVTRPGHGLRLQFNDIVQYYCYDCIYTCLIIYFI